jgi:hypothetical protein
MKLILKEDPREWRKAVWFGALGLTVLSSLLCWRRVLPVAGWVGVLAVLAAFALVAAARPLWFRGYYRFVARIGFGLARWFGFTALVILFLFVLTPLGIILRLCGKDLLGLRLHRSAASYWKPARPASRLEESV